jgi:hypothetical protein
MEQNLSQDKQTRAIKKMVRAEGIVYRQKLKSNQIWFIV